MTVIRMQCISMALGEKPADVFHLGFFWGALSIMERKKLAKSFSETSLQTSKLIENRSKLEWSNRSKMNQSKKHYIVDDNQTILVTAESCRTVKGSGSNIITMRSFDNFFPSSNIQLHQRSNGSFYFNIPIKNSAFYFFSAEVVTVHADQEPFKVTIINSKNHASAVELLIPYTMGKWNTTASISVYLEKGENRFEFSRTEGSLGVSIKHFKFVKVEPLD